MAIEIPELNDSLDFIEVGQNQFGTTSAKSPNPVIKTFGLAGCAALTLYDPDVGLVTLAHISPSVWMVHRMHEMAAMHQGRVGRQNVASGDHLLGQINRLFYSLEDSGSQNARYNKRANYYRG